MNSPKKHVLFPVANWFLFFATMVEFFWETKIKSHLINFCHIVCRSSFASRNIYFIFVFLLNKLASISTTYNNWNIYKTLFSVLWTDRRFWYFTLQQNKHKKIIILCCSSWMFFFLIKTYKTIVYDFLKVILLLF